MQSRVAGRLDHRCDDRLARPRRRPARSTNSAAAPVGRVLGRELVAVADAATRGAAPPARRARRPRRASVQTTMPSGASPRRVTAPSTCRTPAPSAATTGVARRLRVEVAVVGRSQPPRSNFDRSVNSQPLSFWTGMGSCAETLPAPLAQAVSQSGSVAWRSAAALANRAFHLQLDQPVHLDRVLHRQLP